MGDNVVSFKPYIVAVPVCVELFLITMEVTLSFGPFNSHEEGRQWSVRFEHARAEIEAAEGVTIEGVFAGAKLPTRPFIDAHTYTVDVVEAGPEARRHQGVIPAGDPAETAKSVRLYALKALEEAVAFALEHIDDKIED